MANAAYEAALEQVSTMKNTCETMRDQAEDFRHAVAVATGRLRTCTEQLQVVKNTIADNVQGLRQRLVACQAALQAAQEGIGTLDPADVAARLGGLLEGFNAELDGLDDARDQLALQVNSACAEVQTLDDQHAPPVVPQPVVGGGRRRRRRRGGWTPQPPKCRGCCGRGTKKHKKSGKCVGKKKRHKSRRGRRRRKRR